MASRISFILTISLCHVTFSMQLLYHLDRLVLVLAFHQRKLNRLSFARLPLQFKVWILLLCLFFTRRFHLLWAWFLRKCIVLNLSELTRWYDLHRYEVFMVCEHHRVHISAVCRLGYCNYGLIGLFLTVHIKLLLRTLLCIISEAILQNFATILIGL